MIMSLLCIFISYSLCWYGAFHLVNRPPTENAVVYCLSLVHLILSFGHLLIIRPLNRLMDSDVCNTNPQEKVVDEAFKTEQGEFITDDNSNCRFSSEKFKVNKQIFMKSLQDQFFDNEGLHKKPRLTKSGSFPAANLSHKQTEIWPPSQDKESASSSKGELQRFRRPSSPTESMDRYAQMFESRFSKEIKRYGSRSLKLLSKNNEPTPGVFRRVLSLSELKCDPENVYREYCGFENSGETGEDITTDGYKEPGLVTEPLCEEDEMCNIKFFMSEDYQSQSTAEDDLFSPLELVDGKHNYEFHYVKHVLELSGSGAWNSHDQPLNPALYEEMETQYGALDQLKCSTKAEGSRWARRLIFDLINEALVEIYERSCSYYPTALSFRRHQNPMPEMCHLLDKVRAFVARCLDWRPEPDPLLDSAVADELNKNGGWMNLQSESECAALEDLILNELLDEILLVD